MISSAGGGKEASESWCELKNHSYNSKWEVLKSSDSAIIIDKRKQVL